MAEKIIGHTLGFNGLHTLKLNDTPGTDYIMAHPSGLVGITPEGGFAVKLINDTAAASVKGTIVDLSTTVTNGFDINDADGPQPIGVVYENGIADGSYCWVVVYGKCQVLLEDTTASTVGYWVRTSITQAGRADITNAAPPGGGIPELDRHMNECGHCLETKAAGIDVLAYIIFHSN